MPLTNVTRGSIIDDVAGVLDTFQKIFTTVTAVKSLKTNNCKIKINNNEKKVKRIFFLGGGGRGGGGGFLSSLSTYSWKLGGDF